MHSRRQFLETALYAVPALSLPARAARAKDWLPDRPIRLVVPYVAGGATDIAARILAHAMSEPLKQQLVVENRGGAGGNIGGQIVATAAPNGLTLLLGAVGLLTTNPFLYKNMGFNPAKDLAPVSMVYTSDLALVVSPSLEVKTAQEFVALAKSKPKRLNFGSSGVGASTHTAMELFCLIAGIELQHVAYRGSAAAFSDLLGGQIQAMMVQVSTVVGSIQSGELRALLVTGERRNPALPEIATVAEAGYKSAEATAWGGLLAPSGTPSDIIQALNAAAVSSLEKPNIKTRVANAGMEVVTSTPEAMTAFVADETRKWERVVREANITVD